VLRFRLMVKRGTVSMNGALMFGWSTAVILEVLNKTMMISYDTAATD